MIICKKPALLDDHLQPPKGHGKHIFETLHNEIKCVLIIKEPNFNRKHGSRFSHLLTVRADGDDPPSLPPYGQPDRKISIFLKDSTMTLGEGWRYQIGGILGKKSKRPLTPPPHFWKIKFQFFYCGF